MDHLAKIRIPGEARQVLDFIFRKTYGWHKKEDTISLTQFEKGTGLKRSNVVRSLKMLQAMNLIRKGSIRSDTTNIQVYGFQKDFDLWKVVSEAIPSIRSDTKGSIKTAKRVVSEAIHTKEKLQKKTNKRKETQICDEDFWKQIREIYTWVDIDREISKMKGYQLTSKGKNWKFTPKRVIFWLNRIEKPAEVQNGNSFGNPPTDKVARRLWDLDQRQKAKISST